MLADLLLPLLAVAGDDASFHWRDAVMPVDALPAELPDTARGALGTWAAFAGDHEYDLWLNDGGEVLLVGSLAKRKKPSKRGRTEPLGSTPTTELVDETVALVDRIAPEPAGREIDEASRWDGMNEVAVLVQANDQATYEQTIALVAEQHDYLAAWSPGARKLAGYVLQKPLVASWPTELPKADMWDTSDAEWDSDNELVHRLTQLLVMRRFGTQPYWLQVGTAWYVEDEVRGSFYCFPYRDGFVQTCEHKGWDTDLRNEHKKEDFDLGLVSSWQRGTFDAARARRAWGVVRWMVEKHPEALPRVLEDLRRLRATKGRETRADGTWVLLPEYEVTAEDQRAVLAEHLGEGFGEELTTYFRKGCK